MALPLKELVNMCKRIPPGTFSREFLRYLETKEGASEVQWVIQDFLEFYVRKQ